MERRVIGYALLALIPVVLVVGVATMLSEPSPTDPERAAIMQGKQLTTSFCFASALAMLVSGIVLLRKSRPG